MTVAFVVADHVFGDRGGYVAAAAYIVFHGGLYGLNWWAGAYEKHRPDSRRNRTER